MTRAASMAAGLVFSGDRPSAWSGARASGRAIASDHGFTELVWFDHFDDAATLDLERSAAPGFNWYLDLPFSWGETLPSEISVADSVLTLTPREYNANWSICSSSPRTGHGRSFRHGYFEAAMRFDPRLGPTSKGFPAFWSMSSRHITREETERWYEIDFFEASTRGGYRSYNRGIYNTMFQWDASDLQRPLRNKDNQTFVPISFSEWHVFGCLWRPGRVQWYLDGKLTNAQSFGEHEPPGPVARYGESDRFSSEPGAFAGMDRDLGGMSLILGSGPGWPLMVDWVRVWQ